MNQSPKTGPWSGFLNSRWTQRIVDLILVPVLLIYSVWLPPASVGARLFPSDFDAIAPDKAAVLTGPDGATLSVPAGAVEKRTRLRLDMVTASALGAVKVAAHAAQVSAPVEIKADNPEYAALQALPQGLLVYGQAYRLMGRKLMPTEAELSVPVPYELAAVERADLYGWNGEAWQWLPSAVSGDGLNMVAALRPVPSMVVLAQAPNASAALGAVVDPAQGEPVSSDGALSSVTVAGATLADDGSLNVTAPAAGALDLEGARALLHVSNVSDGIVRNDLADNLLISAASRASNVREIVDTVAGLSYSGATLAYANIDAGLRDELTAFVTELADALHGVGKSLAVAVDVPQPAGNSWQTGAYDWTAIGAVADTVLVPAFAAPAAYVDGGDMDRLLTYATDHVQRSKVALILNAHARIVAGGTEQLLPYHEALSLLANRVSTDAQNNMLLPGQKVNLSLPDLMGLQLDLDPDAQVYSFTLGQGGAIRTVQLENAASVTRKLQFANRYGLGGLVIENLLDQRNDHEVLPLLASYQDHIALPAAQFAFVWSIADAQGRTVDQQVVPVTDPNWTWTAPNNPGNYVIRAAVSDDGGKSAASSAGQVSIQVPTPTFTPSPTATPTETPTPTATATNTPRPTNTPGAVAAPAAPAAPAAGAAGRVGGYFGYGIQVDLLTHGDQGRVFDHINAMGFNWVKQQVEWFRYNPGPGQYDWGALDRIVEQANARGINVLFSVVKAPKWARPPGDTDEGPPADLNTYATFMREMAARYKGRVRAYEIWNEQNLYYEWGGRGGKLNAGRYVEMLRLAYNAVKSVDPGAVVISGALTPTGVNDGDIAIDDRLYLEQMYQAGLARYCDAVGAHPSGYNNPPDADWRTYSDPAAPSFKGHPSFFFRGTMESYRNIMVKYGDGGKRIWATEFGWATVENLGAGPAAGYGYAADNTEAEQAQYLVRAYQLGRAWGWAGPMFMWNLNFAPVSGKHDEKAAFGIVRSDWSPRPAFAALRDMAK
jgi:hypothetical protein